MFNLIKYRYAFLLLSLVIIVPGFISLIIFHLNVGIDFSGGGSMQVLPQTKSYTAGQLTTALKLLKSPTLGDLQIVPGSNPALKGDQTVWVKLNTQVDDNNVLGTILKNLQGKYTTSTIIANNDIIPSGGGKPFTLIAITGFKTTPKISDIKSLLSNLPKATPPVSSTATPTPTPTAAATATTTPAATPTPATTGTIPVSVQDIQQGTTNNLFTIQTTTQLRAGDFAAIQAAILQHGGPYMALLQTTGVGPAVAQTTTEFAIAAVLASSFFILLYIWFSFRKLPKAYRYGVCAILAMIHDVLVVVGVFSILGKLLDIQIDALFITALLTVVGFSVHDTIVVFDRIRENLIRRTTESFDQVVNASLIQTMARSLNTSLTVLFTLLALTLFSGAGSVHNFTLALLIGIFSGTYSSIFNASMLLVMWEKGEIGFDHLGGGGGEPVRKRGERDRELAATRG